MFHSEQSLFGKLITSQRIAKDSTLKLQLLISRQILAALTMAQKKNLITFWFTGTACSRYRARFSAHQRLVSSMLACLAQKSKRIRDGGETVVA